MIKKIFLIILLVIITMSIIDLKVLAQDCSGSPNDGQGCSNGGDLRNGCNWICNNATSGTQLVPPPCCETLAQTGDPFACCFDARRRCTPGQCSAISEGVGKQRCGQLWEGGYCNSPSPSLTAVPAPQTPTESLAPTTEPEAQPTTILCVPPDEPRPTINAFPTAEPITSSPQFEFPSINLPKINQLARKPLNLFEYLFKRIIYYDRALENTINQKIKTLNELPRSKLRGI